MDTLGYFRARRWRPIRAAAQHIKPNPTPIRTPLIPSIASVPRLPVTGSNLGQADESARNAIPVLTNGFGFSIGPLKIIFAIIAHSPKGYSGERYHANRERLNTELVAHSDN